MKKTVLAVFCVMMSLFLFACQNSDTAVATTETATRVEETKPEVEDEAPKAEVEVEAPKVEEPEEKKIEEVKPTEVPEPTEEPKVEEAKPTETPEPIEEPKAEEIAEETAVKTEETPKAEEVKPEDTKPEAEPVTPAPVVTTVGTGTDLNSYIADGDFSDAEGYGKAMGAATVQILGSNVDFNWQNYFVEINTSNNAPNNHAYIAIGGYKNHKGKPTYYCVFDFGTPIAISNGTTVSSTAVSYLPAVMNYMKNNPDPNVMPNIPGTTWSAW